MSIHVYWQAWSKFCFSSLLTLMEIMSVGTRLSTFLFRRYYHPCRKHLCRKIRNPAAQSRLPSSACFVLERSSAVSAWYWLDAKSAMRELLIYYVFRSGNLVQHLSCWVIVNYMVEDGLFCPTLDYVTRWLLGIYVLRRLCLPPLVNSSDDSYIVHEKIF